MTTPILIDDRPDVSVIVPTFNNVRYTVQMFASLARNMAGLSYEIIAVDNGSSDETLSFLLSHTPGQLAGAAQGANPPRRVEVLINDQPRALARSWNMGIDAARGRYLLVSNNDVLFAPDAVSHLVQLAKAQPHAGIVIPVGPADLNGRTVGPSIAPVHAGSPIETMTANIRSVEEWTGLARAFPRVDPVCWIDDPLVPQGGYCFLLTRACWERVGRFDEEYDLTGEDWDYFHRARRHFKMARAMRSYVEHFEHVTCTELGDEYHERLCRNRFRLTEKAHGIAELFSVIIPVYNRVDALEAAIDSVIAQRFPHWRIYVVDDGSQDWDRISALAKRRYFGDAGRIWFFHRKRNAGPGAARNYGLGLSRGKYVAFLDSDDVWYPDHLEKHFHAHETGSWTAVYSTTAFAWRSRDDATGRFHYRPDKHPTIEYFGDYDQARLCQHNYIQTSSLSLWGERARQHQFRTDLRVEEDWEYFKEVLDVGGVGRPALHLKATTCRYHISRSTDEEAHLIRSVAADALDRRAAMLSSSARDLAVMPFSASAVPEILDAKIGVVIPTKNRPSDLQQALANVGAVPVVIFDDGSADKAGVAVTVSRHSEQNADAPAALLRSDTSVGASAARNRAVEYLPTEWIRFLDDDDTLTADWLTALLPHLLDDCDIVICSAWVPAEDRRGFVSDASVWTSQIAVRRDTFLRVGGFTESLSWAEERDLIERMEREAGARIKRIAHIGVVRARRGGSGSPSTERQSVTAGVPRVLPSAGGSGLAPSPRRRF